MRRLAVLVLERLHHMDRLDMECLQRFPALRTVSISGCARVQHLQLRDLLALEALQIDDCQALSHLDLKGCSQLHTLPQGVGQLGALQTLNLEGCSALTRLPASVAQLGALETLDLKGCSGLTELPEGLSQLRSLLVLDIRGCSGLPRAMEEPAALLFGIPSTTEPVKLSVRAILIGREHLPTSPSHVPACLRVLEGGEGRRWLLHEVRCGGRSRGTHLCVNV
jgi:hypothetical protein